MNWQPNLAAVYMWPVTTFKQMKQISFKTYNFFIITFEQIQ